MALRDGVLRSLPSFGGQASTGRPTAGRAWAGAEGQRSAVVAGGWAGGPPVAEGLVESYKPAAPAPTRDVARARQGVRALGFWEEDVFDALSAPLDGLHHRLEVAVGRDEDGGIISVLEGAGEHIDS